jgi:hypothetical protein
MRDFCLQQENFVQNTPELQLLMKRILGFPHGIIIFSFPSSAFLIQNNLEEQLATTSKTDGVSPIL